jgi:hypothetical protein
MHCELHRAVIVMCIVGLCVMMVITAVRGLLWKAIIIALHVVLLLKCSLLQTHVRLAHQFSASRDRHGCTELLNASCCLITLTSFIESGCGEFSQHQVACLPGTVQPHGCV